MSNAQSNNRLTRASPTSPLMAAILSTASTHAPVFLRRPASVTHSMPQPPTFPLPAAVSLPHFEIGRNTDRHVGLEGSGWSGVGVTMMKHWGDRGTVGTTSVGLWFTSPRGRRGGLRSGKIKGPGPAASWPVEEGRGGGPRTPQGSPRRGRRAERSISPEARGLLPIHVFVVQTEDTHKHPTPLRSARKDNQ